MAGAGRCTQGTSQWVVSVRNGILITVYIGGNRGRISSAAPKSPPRGKKKCGLVEKTTHPCVTEKCQIQKILLLKEKKRKKEALPWKYRPQVLLTSISLEICVPIYAAESPVYHLGQLAGGPRDCLIGCRLTECCLFLVIWWLKEVRVCMCKRGEAQPINCELK